MNVHTYKFADFIRRYDIDLSRFEAVTKGLPPVAAGGPWLAGGALRRLLRGDPLNSDWDFFFRDEEQAKAFESALTEKGFKRHGGTEHAHTFVGEIGKKPVKVQAIRLSHYDGPEALLDSFDFTICQFAYDGENLHAGEFSLWDLARSRISVHRITYAAASVRRLLKYQTQRYTVCQGAIQAMLEAVAKDPSVIQSEVQYVD